MKNKKIDIVIIFLLGLSLLGILYIYPSLPQTIPTHWNYKGEMDGSGSKSTLFFLWAMTAGLNLLFIVIAKIDPKKENYIKFSKVYHIFRVVMTLFMIGMIVITVYSVHKPTINVTMVTMFMLGVLFMILGNYMPKCKHNYTFGIKTPWTLASENVWNKTHRMAGPIWLASGFLVSAVSVIFPQGITVISVVLLLPTVVLPY
ncbi:MAG: SdpI family protein, partial [Oscillospiraceae bacterium]